MEHWGEGRLCSYGSVIASAYYIRVGNGQAHCSPHCRGSSIDGNLPYRCSGCPASPSGTSLRHLVGSPWSSSQDECWERPYAVGNPAEPPVPSLLSQDSQPGFRRKKSQLMPIGLDLTPPVSVRVTPEPSGSQLSHAATLYCRSSCYGDPQP